MHAKCPPVGLLACYQVRFGGREDRAGRAVLRVSLSAIKYVIIWLSLFSPCDWSICGP